MSVTVLIYGIHPSLLDTRRILLSRSGFNVIVAEDIQRFEWNIRESHPSIAIYCSSLNLKERDAAITLALELRPTMKNLSVEPIVIGDAAVIPEYTVNGQQGPQVFIEAVLKLAD